MNADWLGGLPARPPMTWLCVSATAQETAQLRAAGPRRDFLELQRETEGTLLFRNGTPRGGGWRGRLLGPHVGQAWRAARLVLDGDVAFADGEHVGLPLLAFLRLNRRHPRRVVMLGHLPGRPWKRRLFAMLTAGGGGVGAGGEGVLVVHSVAQADRLRGLMGPRWRLALLPYQVDADYWRSRSAPTEDPPLIVAAGSEHRDYATLLQAVDGLPARVVIAAGSHWARRSAAHGSLPANVEWIERTLPFRELRDLYERSSVVVVPLQDVPNQSGVTTILEGMSMARAVVVSATAGQREIVRGPIVGTGDDLDGPADPERGPQVLLPGAPDEATTGCYVPPGDVPALRAALERLLADRARCTALGEAARAAVERHFTIEAFTARLAATLLGPPTVATAGAPAEAQP